MSERRSLKLASPQSGVEGRRPDRPVGVRHRVEQTRCFGGAATRSRRPSRHRQLNVAGRTDGRRFTAKASHLSLIDPGRAQGQLGRVPSGAGDAKPTRSGRPREISVPGHHDNFVVPQCGRGRQVEPSRNRAAIGVPAKFGCQLGPILDDHELDQSRGVEAERSGALLGEEIGNFAPLLHSPSDTGPDAALLLFSLFCWHA